MTEPDPDPPRAYSVGVGEIKHDGHPRALMLDCHLEANELATLRRILDATGDPEGNRTFQVDVRGKIASVHRYKLNAKGEKFTNAAKTAVVSETVTVHIQ